MSMASAGAPDAAAPAGGFDVALSHRVYAATLGPVERAIAGRSHWIVVPDSTMVGLPFGLLVTQEPTGAEPHWLIRDHALSLLPAVPDLRVLRGPGAASRRATGAFLGVGDPAIGGGGRAVSCGETAVASVAPSAPVVTAALTRSAGGGTVADVEAVRSLPALPETRCELEAIAAGFEAAGERDVAVMLGRSASEARVKAMSADGELARFRVVSFATHGLTGDEVGGGEAALVLTPPERATAEDDGLLTTGEIAGLRLDADWVILSACNTAAGRDAGDEGLSGLASAFFYAGARSLLVSGWPVYSDAAARLTTAALAWQRADPAIGRAEALRRAMLAVLDDPGASARQRHPAYWAPFALVGEGGAPQ